MATRTKRVIAEPPQDPLNTTTELPADEEGTEYLLVTDQTSEVMLSTQDWQQVRKLAGVIRRAGGEVTIFKSTRG
jgi:hypothetical protein